EEIVVLMDDAKGDRDGLERRGFRRRDAGADPVSRAGFTTEVRRPAIESDGPLAREPLDHAPGDPHDRREDLLDRPTRLLLGDRVLYPAGRTGLRQGPPPKSTVGGWSDPGGAWNGSFRSAPITR